MEILNLNNISKKFSNSEFWALKNINLKVNKGEVVGAIGRNGSGKTTLFKIISGIIASSEGSIQVGGKVSSVFTLGTGFQNELSGRENIFLGGSVFGMTNDEIIKKYHEIVNFSELNNFINLPLGNYSDGMKLRLGFSIAINNDFDILIIDEALFVGDVAFQQKCFEALYNFKEKGKTMILCSQDLSFIERFCDRVYLLEEGRIVFSGISREAIDQYRKLLNKREFFRRKGSALIEKTKRWEEDMESWGLIETAPDIAIESVRILNSLGKETNTFKSRDKVIVKVNFESHCKLEDVHFGIAIFREDGVYCYGPNTRWDGYAIDLYPGRGWFSLEYRDLLLAPGKYHLSIVIWEKDEKFAYSYHRGCYCIKIKGSQENSQLLSLPFSFRPFSFKFLFNGKNGCFPLQIKESLYCNEIIKDVPEIIKVNFMNKNYSAREEFITDEKFRVRITFDLHKIKPSKDSLRLWVGIFRSDGIYCHGAFRDLSWRDEEVILNYPQLKLLPGEYRVSVGIWGGKSKAIIAYSNKNHHFNVKFTKQDHGTVYLAHKWKWGFSNVTKR